MADPAGSSRALPGHPEKAVTPDPEFWALVLVLLFVAAMATLCICFGPEPGPEQPEETPNPEGETP